jgi:hypothetical protein
MLRKARRSRFLGTLGQFRALRLQLAVVLGAVLVAAGILADPQSPGGVVCVSLGTGVVTSALISAIVLEREEFAQTVLGLGIQDVFDDRRQAFDNEFWKSLVDHAEQHFRVLGVANHGYARNETTREDTRAGILRAIKERKVRVEFLWLNPEHALAQIREEEEGERGTRRDTVNCIKWFFALREDLADSEKDLLSLKEHSVMPTCGITWSDEVLIVTHYLAQQLNLASPGFVLGPSMSLVDRVVDLVRNAGPRRPAVTEAYISNYREIAASAQPITADRVTELDAFLSRLGPGEASRRSEAEIRITLETGGEQQGGDGVR